MSRPWKTRAGALGLMGNLLGANKGGLCFAAVFLVGFTQGFSCTSVPLIPKVACVLETETSK